MAYRRSTPPQGQSQGPGEICLLDACRSDRAAGALPLALQLLIGGHTEVLRQSVASRAVRIRTG
jgi:hypothetical protein